MTGDYSGDLAETELPQLEPAYGLGGWKRDLFVETTPAMEIIRRRPALVEMRRDTSDIRVKSTYFLFPKPAVARYGFWMNPTGLFRWDGDAAGGMITKNAETDLRHTARRFSKFFFQPFSTTCFLNANTFDSSRVDASPATGGVTRWSST